EGAQSSLPVGRLDHPVAELAQHPGGEETHILLVFDDQQEFAAALRRRRLALERVGERGNHQTRQIEFDRRPLADLAVDLGVPARLPDEAIDLRQAEPSALPMSLVVKNGSKALSITSAGMPVPVSLTAMATYWPARMSVSFTM